MLNGWRCAHPTERNKWSWSAQREGAPCDHGAARDSRETLSSRSQRALRRLGTAPRQNLNPQSLLVSSPSTLVKLDLLGPRQNLNPQSLLVSSPSTLVKLDLFGLSAAPQQSQSLLTTVKLGLFGMKSTGLRQNTVSRVFW